MTDRHEKIRCHADEQGIWHITLDDQPRRNALTRQMRLELIEALDSAAADPGCRALVIGAEGSAFCAGGDISAMGASLDASMEGMSLLQQIVRRLALFPRPVIAAVQGGAHGAGFALALLADSIVAAPGAKFAASFGKVGLGPDTGFMWSIKRRISQHQALQLVATARVLGADEALSMGIVDALAEDPRMAAVQLVQDQAGVAPLSLAGTKAMLVATSDLEGHLRHELENQHRMYQTEDHATAVAAFREKRQPVFRGR